MFCPKQLIEYNNNKDRRSLLEKNTRELISNLGPIKRIKVLKLERTINELAHTIEVSSGWEYLSNEFHLKSDYSFNQRKDDITFKLNSIKRVGSSYVLPQEPSTYIIDFYRKYKSLLDRLATLEAKKESILEDSKTINGNVIDFATAKQRAKSIPQDSFSDDYLKYQAEYFYSTYDERGMLILTNILNLLATNTDKETIMNYLELQNISPVFISNMLSWASTYSIRAQEILDEYNSKKSQETINVAIPDIEEIRTKGMFRI